MARHYWTHEFDWLKLILTAVEISHLKWYIKGTLVFLFGHLINLLLIELSRYAWENVDLGREYRQDFPIQTHLARLITAKYIQSSENRELRVFRNILLLIGRIKLK